MIRLQQVNLHLGPKIILQQADLTVHDGHKLAVVGANGAGKSTLFKLLLKELVPDQGDLYLPKNWRIAHMAQEVAASEQSALDYVLDGHQEFRRIQQSIIAAENAEDDLALASLHGEFEVIHGYQVAQLGQTMLAGLGFKQEQMSHPVSAFSGGWRMRLNLAKALIMPSDLLLLDEPTNHLDLDASLWLESFLQKYRGTLLLISHDRDFIDSVVGGIIHMHQQVINLYTGNYADFERRRAEHLAQQQSLFEQQQAQIAHIESFIDRFKAKASKAKQAQSRVKALERMERIAPAHIDSQFHFEFPNADKYSDPLLNLQQVSIGYGDKVQLESVSLTLRPGDRIGLLGANGAGKSTLIKALVGELAVMQGECFKGEYLAVGYFAQHQVDELDLRLTPSEHLLALKSDASDQQIRNFLGGFGFQGDQALEVCEKFSGGELARLALARIAWLKPNLLILDEPTNHLDLDMRHALTMALQNYDGAIVVVSHDRHLLVNTVDQFYLVHQGAVTEFDGDLEDYRAFIKQSVDQQEDGEAPKATENSAEAKKEKKRHEAEIRKQLSPLKKSVDKLEAAVEGLQEELDALEQQLADTSLYDASSKDKLQDVLAKQASSKSALEETEMKWMAALEDMETLEEQLNA
jgi:ATP-binding cassette subfamily F protein 3